MCIYTHAHVPALPPSCSLLHKQKRPLPETQLPPQKSQHYFSTWDPNNAWQWHLQQLFQQYIHMEKKQKTKKETEKPTNKKSFPKNNCEVMK